jgi:16S rRNA (adenine1518-N6/adenine1519-N6)-dimethyltransferase
VRVRQRFGQHFLAPAWADKVVDAIAPGAGDRFLEIGPGPGALTLRLAPRVEHLTAVEVDRDLAADLAPRLPANAEIVTADFLDFDPAPLLAAGPLRVAGNLPYNISSPILFKLLAASDDPEKRGQPPLFANSRRIVDATVMLQREVADRLAARPGTKDYGVLTIFVTAQADIERVLTLPPGAFRPAPRVHSAVVRLTFKPNVVPSELRDVFARMVRAMFTQRRKTLGNALRPFAESVARTSTAALASAGIDPRRRPETLRLGELVALAAAFQAPGPKP